MRCLNVLFCSIAAATLLGSGPCLAGEGSAASSIAAQRAQLLQAKKHDQSMLEQWKRRMVTVGMGQSGSSVGRRFSDYAKPGEDAANVMRHAAGPSDYESDRKECEQQIAMYSANLKYYDKELEKLDRLEKAAAVSGTKPVEGGFMFSKDEAVRKGNNPIPWKGNFFGVTLPAPEGRNTVCEYTVKKDAVTVRIDGMSWDEYVNYCKTLEKLSGWRVINEEGTARFPAGPRPKGTVYFTGAYGKLPRINVRYSGDELAKKHNRPNFTMFVFETY
jgi:hypothetical protein